AKISTLILNEWGVACRLAAQLSAFRNLNRHDWKINCPPADLHPCFPRNLSERRNHEKVESYFHNSLDAGPDGYVGAGFTYGQHHRRDQRSIGRRDFRRANYIGQNRYQYTADRQDRRQRFVPVPATGAR